MSAEKVWERTNKLENKWDAHCMFPHIYCRDRRGRFIHWLGGTSIIQKFLGYPKTRNKNMSWIWPKFKQRFFFFLQKKNHFLIFGHIDDFSKLHSTVQHFFKKIIKYGKKNQTTLFQFAFNKYSLGARNLGFRYCTTKQSPKYFPFYCMKRGRLLLRLLFKVFWRVKEV